MIVIPIILILLSLFVFNCVWKPWRQHQWYVNSFKKNGYKVLEVPFRPLSITAFTVYDISDKTVDAMAFPKNRYPDYDVVVMNTINRPIIDLINPNLIQDFLSGKNLDNYMKSTSMS